MTDDYEIIGPEYFAAVNIDAVEKIVEQGSYNRELALGADVWSGALRNYLVLAHQPSLVTVVVSETRLLFNQYYWFKKFYHGYAQAHGNNAGIEQQIFMLIETISNTVEDFNWDALQKIDRMIENQ